MGSLTYILFDNPLWLLITLGFVAIIVLAVWRERRTRGWAALAAAAIGLGAAVWIVSALVETDREQLHSACRQIMADLSAGRTDALELYLDEQMKADLGAYGGRADKRGVMNAAGAALRREQLGKVRIGDFEVQFNGKAVVDLLVYVDFKSAEFGSGRMGVALRMRWLERPDGWRIVEISEPKVQRP